jgi:16S rRNA processing protein RimM
MSDDSTLIAQIGRTTGLWGDLKFHLHTDFPEQFQNGKTYQSDRGSLTISDFNLLRGTIRFAGYESIDAAKKLTNAKIYTTLEQTKANCDLKQGEYFWFDLLGCSVKQDNSVLGVVEEVQRMADTDYFSVKTSDDLTEQGLAKHFLLPYIDRYILSVDIDAKMVYTKDAKDILEAS